MVVVTSKFIDGGVLRNVEHEVEKIDGSIFAKIIEWCTHHRHSPVQTEEEIRALRFEPVPMWDAAFLNIQTAELCKILRVSCTYVTTLVILLLKAVNDLVIPGLADVCCRTVAAKLKGKSPDQIRAEFQIENDFQPEVQILHLFK